MGNCRRSKEISPLNPILNHKSCCGLSTDILTVLVVGGKLRQRFIKFARNPSLFIFPVCWWPDILQEAWPYSGKKKSVFRIRDVESSSSTLRDRLGATLAQAPCYSSCVWDIAMWALPEVKCSCFIGDGTWVLL